MATYLIKSEKHFTRQEGDSADVEIIVPEIIDMSNYDARFVVKENNLRTIMDKKAGDISIQGQRITIPILPADTKGKTGKHRWELQINSTENIYTIGRGFFYIVSELIH